MDLDLGRDGAEEMRSTRLDRPKRERKSWLKAVAQGLSPVRGKSRSPGRHFTRSPSDKSSKLDVYSLTFEGLEREEPRSSESTCKDQLSPHKMDFKDLSPTCFAHGGSLLPLGASGSVQSLLSPLPLSDRMETYEPERTPPSEQRGASPERAGGADSASFYERSSGEYCALPDVLGSMEQGRGVLAVKPLLQPRSRRDPAALGVEPEKDSMRPRSTSSTSMEPAALSRRP